MTDLSTPGEINAAVDNKTMAHAIGKAGGHDGYVVDGVDLADNFAQIDPSGVTAFDETAQNEHEITISGGEAFVWGWLVRDTETTVSVPENTTSTVSAGFDLSATLGSGESPAESANVILGTADDFAEIDPRVELFEVTADGTSITDVTDVRPLGRGEAESPLFSGGVFDEAITAPRYRFTADGSAGRFMYDTEMNGQKVHFQREVTSAETAMTFSGTNVGVNETEPAVPLEVGGAIQSEGDRVPTADDDMHFVVSPTEPDEYDVWFEVQ